MIKLVCAPALVLVLLCGVQAQCAAGDWIINYQNIPDTSDGWTQLQQEAAALAVDSLNLGYSSAQSPDPQSFELDFTITGSVSMAVLSDDGVNISIIDQTTGESATNVVSSSGVGQALPDIPNSLKRISYTFTDGHQYSLFIEYSNTVYLGDGDIDGAVILAFGGGAVAMAQQKFLFSPGDAPFFWSAPTTDGNPGGGTGPLDGAKVSPGQTVMLTIYIIDVDQVKGIPPGGPFQTMKGQSWDKTFSADIVLQNATLVGTGKRSGTVDLDDFGGFDSLAVVNIQIDATWNGAAPVTVQITAHDNAIIPVATYPLAAGGKKTDCQDGDISTMLTWTKAVSFPTTVTPVDQKTADQTFTLVDTEIGSNNQTTTTIIWYKYGPNTGYGGITVQEAFDPYTSNIQLDWLNQATQDSIKTNNQSLSTWLNSKLTDSVMSTFTIGPTDQTADTYQLKGDFSTILENYLSDKGFGQNITLTQLQRYTCPPGKQIGQNTVTGMRIPDIVPTLPAEYWQRVSK